MPDYDGSAPQEPLARQSDGLLMDFVNKIRQAIQPISNISERQPLLGGGDSTSSAVSAKKKKVIAGIIVILAIVIIGVVVGVFLLLNGSEAPPPPPKLPPLTDPEKIIVETPCEESVRDFLKIYTSEPHVAGSAADKRQARWTQDKFISYGIKDTIIEIYYPLLNYPVKQQLAIVDGPEELRFEAKLREDPIDEDDTSDNPDATPLFHGYSKNGTALGPVVYANYGRLEDFEFLKNQGIQLEGTIALMRYGGDVHRGLKLRAAEKYGCIGALLYSDPIDDGPLDKAEYPHVNPDKAYPEGPWRSPSSAQRGSVQYVSLVTGDPTTPGWAATADAKRVPRDEHPGMPQIPSLPLSYQDALPLLKAMQGRGVRGSYDWEGGLEDVHYYSGPTEGNAYLVNLVDDRITPIWNVIGRIEGAEEPDKAIILGNHRDAWVYGAVDASSGSAALLELARTFGVLLEKGWRPRRTIILASWDAEEYGMVGSTEWVEDHYEWLLKEAVAYINVDVGISGPHFEAKASPSLNRLLYNVTRSIIDPRTGLTVYDAWSEYTNRTGTPSAEPAVGQLGSGSDFVGFLTYAGIASMDFGFHGDYGVYHSNYDSFHWMEKFGDPTFEYHATLVRIWGLIALHLADDTVLPIYPGDYSAYIQSYITELEKSSATSIESLGALRKASHKLAKTTRRFERRRANLVQRLTEFAPSDELPSVLLKRIEKANKRLMNFERGFVDPNGITGREWFKHVIYAPGLWSGYASRVFPAIVEAIDADDPELLKYAQQRAAHCLYNASEQLKAD